jgi:predicted nucleotidyltransferase
LSSRWEYGHLARRARQWPTREGLIERVAASPLLDGMVLVESFARGDVDPLSDLDLVLVAPEDPGLLDGFPRRPAITRAELDAHLMELHPVEQTYDDFKAAARAALNTA